MAVNLYPIPRKQNDYREDSYSILLSFQIPESQKGKVYVEGKAGRVACPLRWWWEQLGAEQALREEEQTAQNRRPQPAGRLREGA